MVQLGFHSSHEQFAPSALLHYVRLAERAGFQAAMCSDHFHPWSERQGQSGFAWSWLGAAMQATSFSYGVVCAPGQRYHPAIIAQAAATLAEMFPGRFWIAVGSGEALNEHITGDIWPPKRVRNARLEESVDVMRALWAGELVDHEGLVAVRDAKLYTCPEKPPLVIGAALTPQTAEWMGGWADGLITAGASHDSLRRVVEAFRASGGDGKPIFLQSAVCYAATRQQALQAVHDQWRHALMDPSLVLNLNMPNEFDAATEFVPAEALAKAIRISADVSEFIDWIARDIEIGFDAIYFNHVGRDLDTFIRVWSEKVLPQFGKMEFNPVQDKLTDFGPHCDFYACGGRRKRMAVYILQRYVMSVAAIGSFAGNSLPKGVTMKAVVFHDIGDIRLEDVPEPIIKESTDAIVEITASAICGTDLHFVRGTVKGMKPGTILGHEAIGIVADVGKDVHNLRRGDRVVIPSTIACGNCSYCRDGYFAQCDHANPHGRRAGTAFFGGPKSSGGFDGLQAEMARVPYANVGLVKLPDHVTNEQAILLSDVFPSGYFGAELAEIVPGDVVAVFGCGPVGQFAILSALLLGAGRVLAIDNVPSRLEIAQSQGAEVINFDEVNPVHALMELTRGIGPDRVIDAVGVDAQGSHDDVNVSFLEDEISHIERQRSQVCEDFPQHDYERPWAPGDAPLQALQWGVDCVAKSGTLSIIGVYPSRFESFPLGKAFDKNLTVNMGICHHRRYIPKLVQMVAAGEVDPTLVMTRQEQLIAATEAYESFDRRESGWLQVELVSSA